MSQSSKRLWEILQNADSKKITDKKKCVTDLLELFEDQAVLNQITKQTEENTQNTANWPYILYAVHKILIGAADRFGTKDSHRINQDRMSMCTLMLITTRQATKSKRSSLTGANLVSLVLQILENKAYEPYNDTYMNILITYVLPSRTLRLSMLPEQWKQLLKICMSLYENMSDQANRRFVGKTGVLDALRMIVQYGSSQSNLLLSVKKMLPFLTSVFSEITSQISESAYKLASAVCYVIGTESRFALCEFGENILPHILSRDGSAEKYKLLLFLVQIHHPAGARLVDETTYAHDRTKWKTLLQSMYTIVLRDCKAEVLSKSFKRFAAEIFKQVIDDPTGDLSAKPFYENVYNQPTKRRRITSKIEKPVDFIDNCAPEEAWSMVQILEALFSKYPKCLKPNDIEPLLKTLTDLLAQSGGNEKIVDSFYQLATVIMRLETSFNDSFKIESTKLHWEKVWDILLRSLSLNQNEVSGHRLVQMIIRCNRMVNVDALLRLYFTKAVRWSPCGVQTLMSFCERMPLPNEPLSFNVDAYSPTAGTETIKFNCLKWALNIPWQKRSTQCVIQELSDILVGITGKSWHVRKTKSTDEAPDIIDKSISNLRDYVISDFELIPIETVEYCCSTLAYDIKFRSEDEEDTSPVEELNANISFTVEDLDFLRANLCDLLRKRDDDAYVLLIKTTLVARIISTLRKLNVILDDLSSASPDVGIEASLQSACELLSNIATSKAKFKYLVNVTRALNILYGTSYDEDTTRRIISSSTRDMLKSVFDMLNVEDCDTMSYNVDDRQKVNDEVAPGKSEVNEGIIRTNAIRALTLFCCMDTGEEKLDVQKYLMKNLLLVDLYDFKRAVDFNMAFTVLKLLTRCNAKHMYRSYAEMPVKFLVDLFRECYKNESYSMEILSILPCYLKYAIAHNIEAKDLLKVFFQFAEYLRTLESGPHVYVEFIGCLSAVAEIQFLYRIKWTDSALNGDPIVENVMLYINSPFYVVRLKTIRCIQRLFSSKDIDFSWKSLLFTRLKDEVYNIFTVNRDVDDNEKLDEKTTRVATALLTLASVISTNGVLQSEALLTMLRLAMAKRIRTRLVERIIQSVTRQLNYADLIRDNLNYLLSNWCRSEYSLNDFPWSLAGCESEEEFCRKHINELTSINLQISSVSESKAFCDRVGQRFAKVLEDIFPEVFTWLLCYQRERSENDPIAMGRMSETIDKLTSSPVCPKLITSNLDRVIVSLVKRLHDEVYFNDVFGVCITLPKSDPPHFTRETIDSCLTYVASNFFSQGKRLEHVLATNNRSALQKVLLSLTSNIYSVGFEEHKLQAFQQYTYFCTIIAQTLNDTVFDEMCMFVIRDISHTLLNLIKELKQKNNCVLAELACKYFQIFLRYILPTRANEFSKVLSFCVATLVPIVQSRNITVVLDILKFLIIDQQAVLNNAIRELNSFPNKPEFEELRTVHDSLKYKTEKDSSLETEITRFLSVTNNRSVNCTTEELSHLRQLLSTRKSELRAMYDKLHILRFAEDCVTSSLHLLSYRLIKLTASRNELVSMEAAKCLGEIGPIDLTTMILFSEESYQKEDFGTMESLSCKVIDALCDFIVADDIELRRTSAATLYAVLDSSCGKKLFLDGTRRKKQIADDPEASLRYEHVKPFLSTSGFVEKQPTVDRSAFTEFTASNNLIWSEKSAGSYSDWITEITCAAAACFESEGHYIRSLIPVCKLSVEFCELILARIVYLMIRIVTDLACGVVCARVNEFFRFHAHVAKNAQQPLNGNHKAIRCMLNVVNFIRIQTADDVPLQFDYVNIARAAQHCSAYFTAILYTELSCQTLLSMLCDCDDPNAVSRVDYICERKPDEGRVLQDILKDAYLKIGDPDAIYGCGSFHLRDQHSRVQHYIHMRMWDKVMLAQDVELCWGNNTGVGEMVNALQQSGLQYLLGNFTSSVSHPNIVKVNDEFQYDSAWRLSNWNLVKMHDVSNFQDGSHNTAADYYFHHYQALKFFHENDLNGTKNAIENARRSIIKDLRNVSFESSKTVYEKLAQLQMLREIEKLGSLENEDKEIFSGWLQCSIKNTNEFQYVEPILTQRTVMCPIIYQVLKPKEDRRTDGRLKTLRPSMSFHVPYRCESVKRALEQTYLEIAEIAQDQGYLQVAARALGTLAKLDDLSPMVRDQLDYQESLLAWARNDQDIARVLLRGLMNKPTLNDGLKAQVLRVYGNWTAEMKWENPQTIIKKYYEESVRVSTQIDEQTADDVKNLHATKVALAKFADAQFEQISAYIKSPQFESFRECVEYSRNLMSMNMISGDQELNKAVKIGQLQRTNDVAELENIQNERQNYLELALRYYLMILCESNDYNLLIFRLIALWQDNAHNEAVNRLLNGKLMQIPMFKFIPLVPQLAAHMSNVLDEFSGTIYRILERCALEHPHHTLPVLLALKNLLGDYEYEKKPAPKQEPSRVLGAKMLLNQLARTKVKDVIREMNMLSHSLVMLANFDTGKSGADMTYKLGRNQEIVRVKDFENVLLPTITIGVQPTGNYKNIIGVRKYIGSFETVGGRNAPKKITCVGTDGICRKQLVKGKDDLRQDAVMQQVFSVMNELLSANKETKRRKLKIRTYKIVPLTQRSGVLEWCDNTVPVILPLIGSKSKVGLHRKYYPNDYTAEQCCKKMTEVLQNSVSTSEKLRVFMDCCKHFHPAFQYFFIEKFPSPEVWFERRLAYTRSVATTSIAGYIMGLGDRHLRNILIDQSTAEVIHIDFGIAFEQGKVLPIPEIVPFRLSRDIESAMGVSGVDGIMRRSCEEMMSILRDQRQIIITLLQVLIYDPLFTWAITPAKAYSIQLGIASKSDDGVQGHAATNKTAERALLRIEQKLQGTEEGVMTSVAGQVERLIQQARDPSNLCRLYVGWRPFL